MNVKQINFIGSWAFALALWPCCWSYKKGESALDIDLVFKIAAIGILVAVLNILLSRAGRDEQALMTTIAGLVVVLVLVIQKISELFDLIKSLFSL